MRIRQVGRDETAHGCFALPLGRDCGGSGARLLTWSIVLHTLFDARRLIVAWTSLWLVATLLWPTFGHAADTSTSAWQRVQRVFDEIRARYPGRIDEEALANRAIQAMLQGLDRHSMLLDENAYRVLKQDIRGTRNGLGVEVELERDALTIKSTAVDAPAYQAGLRAGDRITMLDGVSVAGLTLEQALRLVGGETGSNLRLTVLRSDKDAPWTVTVERARAARSTVSARRLEHDVAYLRVERFQQSTPQLVMKALKSVEDSAAREIVGLVLDLRDNPGGSVRAAVDVSAAFLPDEALVVTMEGPSIGADARLFVRRDDGGRAAATQAPIARPEFSRSVPMVVLIDGGSASAAEILAGALQDHGRALLVGTRTYGKGSVQSIVPLGDGTAMKVTAASYRTPNGRVIQGRGLEPDSHVAATPGDDQGDPGESGYADSQLDEALRILEKVLSGGRQRASAAATATTAGSAPVPESSSASSSPAIR